MRSEGITDDESRVTLITEILRVNKKYVWLETGTENRYPRISGDTYSIKTKAKLNGRDPKIIAEELHKMCEEVMGIRPKGSTVKEWNEAHP